MRPPHDHSWRDLSAVSVHLQSQPLPNPVAAAVSNAALPAPLLELATLGVLVVEMAAPFLFLAPAPGVRRVAFALNARPPVKRFHRSRPGPRLDAPQHVQAHVAWVPHRLLTRRRHLAV